MAVLILPPVQFIADSLLVPAQVLKQAQEYQHSLLTQFNTTAPISTLKEGGYKGTQVFNWKASYDGILVTYVVFEKGAQYKKEWVKIAALIRKEDCVVLGNTWNVVNKSDIPFPLQNSSNNLSQISKRTFSTVSPVKINTHGNFLDTQHELVFETVLNEEFAKNKIFTISSEGRLLCQADIFSNKKEEKKEVQTKKKTFPQRLLEVQVNQTKPVANNSGFVYSAQLHSAVFGQPIKIGLDKNSVKFNPQEISKNIVEKTTSNLPDLKQEQFKIIRRFGSWVYLESGRSLGLKIGLRMVGPGKSTLHILKYAPYFPEQSDASVAFIRHESADSPLKEGDLVSIDKSE